MIWFISDTHFNHDNVIKYENRPFESVEEMNEEMILEWNEVVQPDDEVYHLGDFIMGAADTIHSILPRLNGKIHLIRGNHDTKAKLDIYKQYPDKIVEIKEVAYLPYHGRFFVMCHFPLTNEDFLKMVNEDNSEVIILHGHVHSKMPFTNGDNHVFNVSADVINYRPVSIQHLFMMTLYS